MALIGVYSWGRKEVIMNFIEDIILDVILIMFPVLIYFIYNCYREVCMEKYNGVILDVMLVSSMYLCFKYGSVNDNILGLLFCNLPIVVAYLKGHSFVGVMLSLIVVAYSYFYLHLMVLLMIVKFLVCFVIYLVKGKCDIRDKRFILVIAVVQGFFFSLEYFYIFSFESYISIIRIFFYMLLFYLLPFSLLYLFSLAEKVTSLYLSVSELERDKQIKNSLFKITHEVKNPIAVCKGYLDMMRVYDREQVERYVPIIRQEITRSLDIMSDFMEFSKIKVEREIIDINMLLEDILEEMELFTRGKCVELDLRVINDEVYVMGDYNRLRQVFINLIKNSMEAMEGGGRVGIVTHLLKGSYYVEVSDNGSGMDEDTLRHIKDMFFTTKVKGTGLGVSLSNEIIKAHEGSLEYFSKLGKGTKVVVKLPVTVL